MQISAPFQIFVCALTLVWNAFKRRAYLSTTNLKVIYSLQVPGRFSYPLYVAHYPMDVSTWSWPCVLHQTAPVYISPDTGTCCVPQSKLHYGEGFLGECPATAEGPASPSSGSYSAAGPDQGEPPGTAGRRGGQRGSRRRPSGRSSRSGGRAGAKKSGEKDVVTSSAGPSPQASKCPGTCPNGFCSTITCGSPPSPSSHLWCPPCSLPQVPSGPQRCPFHSKARPSLQPPCLLPNHPHQAL